MKHNEEKNRQVEKVNTLFDSDLAEYEYVQEQKAKVEAKKETE